MKRNARLIVDNSGKSIRVSEEYGGTMEFNPETLEPYGPGIAIGSKWEAHQFQKTARAFKVKMETQEAGEWPGTCICDEDLPEGVQPDFGHHNQAGGFCCPHYGNTCGHCHEYDGRPAR